MKASDVLAKGHGICHAKSILLAAMLRYFEVPTGFCYQKLCSDGEMSTKILHGLNAVYINEHKKWIRIDARGNKPGVDAQFSIYKEKIAWPANRGKGEEDFLTIYPHTNEKIIEYMKKSKSRSELWKYLEYSGPLVIKDKFGLV